MHARSRRLALAAAGCLAAAPLTGCTPEGSARDSQTSGPPSPPPSAAQPVVPTPPSKSDSTGCIAQPSRCGYPDATNTGWRPTGVTPTADGVKLTEEGELIITEPGTVLDAKDIQGCVSIKADDVTIKRSRIRCASYYPVQVFAGFKNVLLEDVEIDGLNSPIGNAAVGFDGYTLRRADIHHVQDGPHLGGDVLITDSYVHDLVGCDICHNDAIQSNGARNAVLRHNTFTNQASGKNAAVRIATEQAPVHDFTVEDNLLAGGNFAVQVRSQGHGFPQNVRVIGNRIVPDWRFGPFDVTDGTITAEGNYRDDTLAPVRPA
ncbi:right-handed parallel beta-helix repeat-containing protein [Amycolatopsis anabasis]|uniref:right-handed parallel beta-helix repeat-containing protein n=1 Tax=Amycolatopsis anabasis TaxID=1840409 RepID=UPI00131C6737|nr:right-handed parallel beta-helix repeat-containing protein [Amycolatopsis anabasis]